MKNTDLLKSLSTEELLTKRKKAKAAQVTLVVIIAIAFMIQIYAVLRTKNYAFIAIGFSGAVLLIPGLSNIKEMDEELKRRA
ncbi:hypothetical protein MUY27_19860 [Mucilaginibacter sp. RS28]|uniref:Redox-active disulfide protein 2 n=1 Tax=Mucilaginibacter straminoryzae TaxID=2932774 RepID=A0A9X1XBX8_9SPHI|nr:hypothetical protein [Mucilaginibacter straminoryzae]MCJ8211984.1 hypothetical protein [Mucilaginibacter straminoryzae]